VLQKHIHPVALFGYSVDRSFIKDHARTRDGGNTNEDSVMLEDALVPVAVSGFDLLRMRGVLMSQGCMAKAAR
jgi:hypothetical protein